VLIHHYFLEEDLQEVDYLILQEYLGFQLLLLPFHHQIHHLNNLVVHLLYFLQLHHQR
jgi:hypothetical protein